MTIEARPRTVAIDASAIVVVKAPLPNLPVVWSIIGNGVLEPLSVVTDGNGVAAAKLTPTGAPGDQLQVTAQYSVG